MQVQNESAVAFELERLSAPAGVNVPGRIVLPPGKVVIVDVRAKGATALEAEYGVKNLLIGPEKPLIVKFDLQKGFSAAEAQKN